ncbi:hypothetical protein [Haloarcula nitratireducens]|uniref:Uncharacterized protein n=1 Tax=Haloarcula nitratireducens TaxID=2487749 RepID=A0AAW4PH00_9EURY|nr:hypothetical protein [Halomicroarcula nitratireducens]MBX0296801.1 hypothetical protein [Halomicroarcula nitratireducens]
MHSTTDTPPVATSTHHRSQGGTMNTDQHTVLAIVTSIVAKGCFAGIALAKLVEPGSEVSLGGYLALAFSCSTVSAVAQMSR